MREFDDKNITQAVIHRLSECADPRFERVMTCRSIRPTFYPVPTDGPVGRMLRKMRRHPYRPGHIHMIVSAPGHLPATTHLFFAGSEYLDSDAVFGMKESLVAQFDRHPPAS
jgi:hydroxyquinol 1,2-dioxygenase